MDYEAMGFWFNVFITIGLFGNWLYMWLTNRQRVNKAEIEQVNKSVYLLTNQISLFEEKLKGTPTHNDLSNIYNRINGMSQDISEMTGAVKALTTQMSLINQHLINGGGRS
tara:strand:- start:53635 stop:53967 length:333 start_codon:yes stop_codon:yes gene_type:complete